MAVGVFSSAKGGACLCASDRDGLSCAAFGEFRTTTEGYLDHCGHMLGLE